jgi:addiction module HigA family antidote
MSREASPPRCPAGPIHPGALLREQVLPALGLTVSQAALDLSTTRQNLHRILSGRTAITPEMAVRLERFCGISASFWLERQQGYDLSLAQKELPGPLTGISRHSLPNAVLIQIGVTHD